MTTRRNPAAIDPNLILLLAAGYLVYSSGLLAKLLPTSGGQTGPTTSTPPTGTTPVTTTPATTAPSGGSGGATEADIVRWATGIGLSVGVGRQFVADHGRLPASIPELESWGNSNGYRQPDGSWHL